MKTKLVEIIPNLGNGGAEKFVYDICNNINKNKFILTLILLYDDFQSSYYKQLKFNGINIITLHKKKGFDFKIMFRLNRLLKKLKPKIIHSHLSVNLYLFSYYLFNKNQIGFHTVHSIADKEQLGIHKKITNWLYHKRNVKPVAIGNYVAQSIEKEYKLKDKKFPVIYNGINIRIFKKKNNLYRLENIKFVTIGSLYKVKNHSLMLYAFRKVVDKYGDVHLDILGDGELRYSIKELITELQLVNNVTLVGSVCNVQEYLQDSDCFIMSSDFEGLPLSVLEAMSCGLPIITTKAGGIVDIVQDGYNGYLSDVGNVEQLANNILKVIENKKLEEFGKRSLELSKHYDIIDCVRKYEDLFLS